MFSLLVFYFRLKGKLAKQTDYYFIIVLLYSFYNECKNHTKEIHFSEHGSFISINFDHEQNVMNCSITANTSHQTKVYYYFNFSSSHYSLKPTSK